MSDEPKEATPMADAPALFSFIQAAAQPQPQPPAPLAVEQVQLPDGRVITRAEYGAMMAAMQSQPTSAQQPQALAGDNGGTFGFAPPQVVQQPIAPPQVVQQPIVQRPTVTAAPAPGPVTAPPRTRTPKPPKANSVTLILKCAEEGHSVDYTKSMLDLLASVEREGEA